MFPNKMQHLTNSAHIHLALLAESGQAFRVRRLKDDLFVVPSNNTVFIVEQRPEGLYYETFSHGNPESIEHFFRTDISLKELHAETNTDPFIQEAYRRYGLIPLVRQHYFETVISFIISANKHFKHICQCVEAVCANFGVQLETPYGVFSLFPSTEQLAQASVEDLRACKVGYRAEYIQYTAQKLHNDPTLLERIESMSDDNAIAELKTLLGVGDKVADCILLFGYGRDLVVPYDIWLHRIMHDLYEFPENTPYHVYRTFNAKHFGRYAGWIQQLLFYHARNVHKRGTSLKETWFEVA